jgi:hypothetical protein
MKKLTPKKLLNYRRALRKIANVCVQARIDYPKDFLMEIGYSSAQLSIVSSTHKVRFSKCLSDFTEILDRTVKRKMTPKQIRLSCSDFDAE